MPRLLVGIVTGLAALLANSTVEAATETVLYRFMPGTDGEFPSASLIMDKSGILYGTTTEGGHGPLPGTVFKLTPPAKGKSAWTEKLLYTFGNHVGDGVHPYAGLIADDAGVLYGTTEQGGISGHGAVFRLTPPGPGKTAWTEKPHYSFKGKPDGDAPVAGLTIGADGALYGTTQYGGSGFGTAFRLTPPAAGQTRWS